MAGTHFLLVLNTSAQIELAKYLYVHCRDSGTLIAKISNDSFLPDHVPFPTSSRMSEQQMCMVLPVQGWGPQTEITSQQRLQSVPVQVAPVSSLTPEPLLG